MGKARVTCVPWPHMHPVTAGESLEKISGGDSSPGCIWVLLCLANATPGTDTLAPRTTEPSQGTARDQSALAVGL